MTWYAMHALHAWRIRPWYWALPVSRCCKYLNCSKLAIEFFQITFETCEICIEEIKIAIFFSKDR